GRGRGGAVPRLVRETRAPPTNRRVRLPGARSRARNPMRTLRKPRSLGYHVALSTPCRRAPLGRRRRTRGRSTFACHSSSPGKSRMVRSNAGKARIGIVWLVVVGVLFLIAGTLAFVTQSDLETEKGRVTTAEAQLSEKVAEVAKLVEERKNLSTVLGWYPRESESTAQSDPEAARKALDDLKTTFPDIGAAEKDFEKALEKIVAAYDQRGSKLAELETRIKGLESELSAA